MKYCPSCGNLLNGKFECLCGWIEEECESSEKIGVINSDFKTGAIFCLEDFNNINSFDKKIVKNELTIDDENK